MIGVLAALVVSACWAITEPIMGASWPYPAGIEDNTHFSPRGAEVMAGLAVAGIRELKLELAGYLVGVTARPTTRRRRAGPMASCSPS